MRFPLLTGFLALVSPVLLAASARPDASLVPPLPEFNVVAGARAPVQRAVPPHLLAPGKPLHRDEAFGVPSFLWANPLSAQAPATAGGKAANGRERAAEVARAHLAHYADIYGLKADSASAIEVRAVQTLATGPTIVQFTQRYDGIEVYGAGVKVLMDRNLALKSISGHPSAHAASQPFVVPATDAIARALSEMTNTQVQGGALTDSGTRGEYTHYHLTHSQFRLSGTVRARKIWFDLPANLEPAWYLEVGVEDGGHYAYIFSAQDGRLLLRQSLIADAAHTYRVWADPGDGHLQDGPQDSVGTPHPTGIPDRYQAPFVAPSLVTLDYLPTFTAKDPWLPVGAIETMGNNVDVYADLVAPDGFTAGADMRAPLSSTATFDYTYDPTLAPGANNTQRYAGVTTLFYTINYLHDLFYDHGFDEVAGNGQTDNFGRGGLGNDAILAEAQDYSGKNNANMMTPADGVSPRMQMFLWDANELSLSFNPAVTTVSENGTASFGPSTYSLLTVPVAAPLDTAGLTTMCGPSAVDLTGQIALIDRGTCAYTVKVKYAQDAGAVGALIANNVAGVSDMVGVDNTITIPSLMLTQADGAALRTGVAQGAVTATMEAATFDRDGTIDALIVAHEWGHYLSTRLAKLGGNQAFSMGEGWSDFVALLMTVEEADRTQPGNESFNGTYSVGPYAYYGPSKRDNFYFGARRYPYSTDMTKNPLTFRHIADGEVLPVGPPMFPRASNNAEVHNAGEVWAVALWEVYVALLNDSRYTFSEARSRMLDYLVAHLKLMPADPTYTEARDAMLAVAQASDAGDFALMLQAFAKRGLALAAVSPDRFSTTHAGVVESFLADGAFARVSATSLDFGLVPVDTQQTQVVEVTNWGTSPLTLTGIAVDHSAYKVGGTCASGTVLSTASSCSIEVTYAPLTHGVQRADLTISHDGLDGLTVVTLAGEATSDSYQMVSQANAISIPDVGLATAFPSTLTVAGIAAPVQRVELVLDGFSHTGPLDVIAVLTGPGGQSVVVMDGAGGGRPGVSDVAPRFAGDATDPIPQVAFSSGLYLPANYLNRTLSSGPVGPYGTDLGIFQGLDPNGDWQLYVEDKDINDSGSIAGWRLLFTLEDAQPRPFSFASVQTSVPGSVVESAPALIRGITVPIPISAVGGEYAVNGGAYTSAAGFVNEGDQVRVRVTAPAQWVASASATLTAGDQSAEFVVTTGPVNNAPTAPSLVFPADGQIGVAAPVVLRWEGASDPDGDKVSYELYVCANQDFTGCEANSVAMPLVATIGGLGALALIGGLSLVTPCTRRRYSPSVFVAFVAMGMLISCSKGGGGDNAGALSPAAPLTSSPATLASGTTYYWKVVAIDSKGVGTSSAVWSFVTE